MATDKINLKSLANQASKMEMFSLKSALNAVKNAFDADSERKETRAYIEGLGFGAQNFKKLDWQVLVEFTQCGKTGKYCTWYVLGGLKKFAEAYGILEKKEEAAKVKAAKKRINAKKGAAKKAA